MPPSSTTVAQSLRLPCPLDDALRELAHTTRTSKNAILCEALQLYLTIYRATSLDSGE